MHHTVAQQVLEGGGHPVQHAAVHFDVATRDVETHLLAGFLRSLAHHAVQALGNAFKFHHAGAQQIALQFPGLARLSDQTIFGHFHRSLQVALHRGHVVDRLRHHAGQLLNTGEPVEFQRVKGKLGIAGLCQAGLHLRFGLQLQITQLLPQAVQVAGELFERPAHGEHL